MQKDLFGGSIATPIIPASSESRYDFLHRYRVNLRLDQAIIAVLLLVVAYVLVFSFGVESGKRYAMAEIKAERSMRERMARELGEKIFANAGVRSQAVSSDPSAQNHVSSQSHTNVIDAYFRTAETVDSRDSAMTDRSKTKETVSGRFLIQTVTFTSKAAAEKQIKKLSAKGYQGVIIPKGKFQQVCVSGFESREKALSAMSHLKNEGLALKDAYIRPLA